MKTADQILQSAIEHMRDRASTRDQPEGERSMARTVAAFNAITGHNISERDGWFFMVVLKAARACSTPTGIGDDYEDGAAYFGLAGEAASVPADSLEAFDNKSRPAQDKITISPSSYPWGSSPLPEWARWVAQDENDLWYAYEERPHAPDDEDCWKYRGGKCARIGASIREDRESWRYSLMEVPRMIGVNAMKANAE